MPSRTAADPALIACAHRLADRAAEVTLPYFRVPLAVDNKASGTLYDPVTAADRSAEQIIEAELASCYPDHGLEGEEFGLRRPEARFRWLVDPIDGTRAFITGSPMWGTLIGLMDGCEPLLGLMDQPYTGERFWSDSVSSLMRRQDEAPRRIKTRSGLALPDAVFMTTDPALFRTEREQRVLRDLRANTRLTRYGGDCYAYALLAMGFVDVIAECGLNRYDIVPLIPIIEAAGGRVTDWKGDPATQGGAIVASGDPKLHEQILKVMGD